MGRYPDDDGCFGIVHLDLCLYRTEHACRAAFSLVDQPVSDSLSLLAGGR